MTPHQAAQVVALSRCTFSPGSWAKQFVRSLDTRDVAVPLTEPQIESLEQLAHSYRKQLGKCMATRCEKCGTPAENDDVPNGTLERFKAATVTTRFQAPFMALERGWRGENEFFPVGGKSPSTFKLYRNARAAAGDYGFVVLFDPRMLPLVGEEATAAVDWGDKLDEESFAERQMLYWAQELQRIRKSLQADGASL